ncbi:MAG: NAD(P)-dependent oxidoreductase [Caulobacteraceae bacterium]|nr:NAD(P)-dependent oxidoreductase [Caulobacteraceae bacterium]
MPTLRDKTLFITGASRGIGLAIAVRAAREGANVAIAAKTGEPHRHLPGTIYTAAKAVEEAGGRALPLLTDVRDEAAVAEAVARTVETFGGIDVCVNNASAIDQSNTLQTEMKRFDLVHDVVARGSFLVSKLCIPHLMKAENPHVLMLSPPPVIDKAKLAGSLHNTLAKFYASLCVVGMAEEFREAGIAFNALRPRTWIATSAIRFRRGEAAMGHCRKPEIMADAACEIFRRPSREYTGNFVMDDEVLYEAGERDFEKYRVDDPSQPLYMSAMSPGEVLPDHVRGVVVAPVGMLPAGPIVVAGASA